jgi:DNA-binding transcriptional MerR regulator
MEKSPEAFRTIREVADAMDLPQHVLRFWETRFPQIRPLKRAGGRRYYRPEDVERLRLIKRLLYDEGYTIKGVQKLFKQQRLNAFGSGARAPAESQDQPGVIDETPASGFDAKPAPAPSDRQALEPDRGPALSERDLGALRQVMDDLREAERILAQARSNAA